MEGVVYETSSSSVLSTPSLGTFFLVEASQSRSERFASVVYIACSSSFFHAQLEKKPLIYFPLHRPTAGKVNRVVFSVGLLNAGGRC